MKAKSENLIHRLVNSIALLEEEYKQLSELAGLTGRQERCIELIYELENPTLSEIAKLMGVSKPSASNMLDRLVENDFVYRVKSDLDRRSAHVHLSDKGIESAHLQSKLYMSISEYMIGNLTDTEREKFSELLNKAVVSLEEHVEHF